MHCSEALRLIRLPLVRSIRRLHVRAGRRGGSLSDRLVKRNDTSIETRALKPLNLEFPARHYPKARRIKRQVHLHIGPTNSGKSYTALLAFKQASSGYYAGPLRMLAREIYDRMENENIPCNLVTGDEILEKKDAKINSGTVEMMDLGHDMELAVIDEIQMIEDSDRGWAWTRAFLGVRAKVLHLCGDPSSENIVRALAAEAGDELIVHRYERLSPLEVSSKPLVASSKTKALAKGAATNNPPISTSLYKAVEPGDCVVCFSKRQVQSIRDKIVQAHGNQMCCSLIYGSLPAETRAEQARLFNNYPETKVNYLVASDAIGMGLNLGIKRIIFTTLQKFDGHKMRPLEISEIKQIAGRAGRFRTADGSAGAAGVVTCLNKSDIEIVKKALASPTPVIEQAVLMPPPQKIRSALIGNTDSRGQSVMFSTAMEQMYRLSITGDRYKMPRQSSSFDVSGLADRVLGLTFEDRMVLANAPVPMSMPVVAKAFTEMCYVIGSGRTVNVLELFPELMSWLDTGKAVPQTLEVVHKTLTLFLWVSYRFPCNFADRTGASDLKRLCEHQFDVILRSSRRHLTAPGRVRTTQAKAMSNRVMASHARVPLEKLQQRWKLKDRPSMQEFPRAAA